nr:Chain A, PawL-Derived Peptide PLP-42 [Sanvitalia procumbens]
TFFNPVID